ncbi:MAG TPA: thiamine-phosphate kinase [Solirubrobacterales bacterium]|nr:thiamine-phosphate kinase [Solirubrobacterales bacterium]
MGEFELLALLRERLPTAGPRLVLGSGDDAAITAPGGAVATSVDALVEGVHFRRETASLRQIGCKALSTALSDLAAMGAEAGEAYIVLGAPAGMSEAELLELGEGMAAVAGETGTAIAGGDLTRAPVLTLAVTVTGYATRAEDFVTRGGAREGDVLVVTGELGGAAAGLLLIEDQTLAAAAFGAVEPLAGISPVGDPTGTDPPRPLERTSGERLDLVSAEALRRRQLDPTPLLAAGQALAAAGATAMIDVSDGLAGDANHVAVASDALLTIDADALPIAKGVAAIAVAADRDPLELATSGGEDYELFAALPPDAVAVAREALAALGTPLTVIGQVESAGTAGPRAELRRRGGEALPSRGFDQLDPRRPR